MKLGFTTQSFIECIHLKKITEEDLIDFAKEHGFCWVEIRNKGFTLSKERLTKIKDIAAENDIAVHYAWDGGSLFNNDYKLEFKKELDFAEIFGAHTISRVTIDTNKILSDKNKYGYDTEEKQLLCTRLNEVIEIAQLKDIQLAFENAYEPIHGGIGYYGFSDLLESVQKMKMTFDPANFLNKDQQKVLPDIKELSYFYQRYKSRIPYIHIKSTKEGILQKSFLMNGDFKWTNMLNDKIKWYCIELPSSPNLFDCKERVLQAKELIENRAAK